VGGRKGGRHDVSEESEGGGGYFAVEEFGWGGAEEGEDGADLFVGGGVESGPVFFVGGWLLGEGKGEAERWELGGWEELWLGTFPASCEDDGGTV